jgi:LAS superfamily LD-carboxypeptidase LdcB
VPRTTCNAVSDPVSCALDALELTGRASTHVIELAQLRCTLHPHAAEAYIEMRSAAAREGLDIAAVSSFRDFARQLAIWNGKFRGERPLYDRDGRLLDRATLAPAACVDTILLWSALPGASRHHWGSDFDVIDRAALPPDQRWQLLPHEFAPHGVFARLEGWLAENLARYGFFRPYGTERGGVRPEPWHLSFAPVASGALRALTPALLREALAASAIDAREEVLARIDELHERYVLAVDAPPVAALAARGSDAAKV